MSVRYDEYSNQGAPDTHHKPMKWLSKKTCLKCNERGSVLVCSNVNCPIVVHKHCLACTAYFDNQGNFYCPYCAYKQAFDECQKARECTILAKKTLAAFLDTKSVRSTRDDPTVDCSERERLERSDSTFRNDNFRSGLVMNSDVPKIAVENRKIHSGRVGETTVGEQSLKQDVHIVRDNVTPAKLKFSEMESLKTKHHETAMPSEANDSRGIQWKQKQRETNGVMIEKDEGREQLKVNLENGHPSPKVPKDHCGNKKTLVRSPKNAAYHTRKHNASVTPKESGGVSRNDEETRDTEEVSYEEAEEKEQQVETSMYLTREDDLTVINDTSIKGDGNEFHAAVNSEDAVFRERRESQDAMDVNYSGLANEVHKQTEGQEPTTENVEKVNYGVYENENLPRNHEPVNKNNTDQNFNMGDFHFKKDEERKHVNLRETDGISMSKENKEVSYEELDTEDERKSSQESHHTGCRTRSKRKSRISGHSENDNQSINSDSFSNSDFEDCEEVTRVKSRLKVDSSKKILRTPISIGRRKKLTWTKEEEETLKEGVDKFSLTTKKNTPWLKILEFGSHVFDGTRTPDDLKDKWRRILLKAHENA